MNSKKTHVRMHRGYAIHQNEAFHFEVSGKDIDGVRTFESVRLATEAIDNLIKEGERAQRVAAKLKLTVITHEGVAASITGVHPRNRTLNGIGDTSKVYPDVPWIAALLKDKATFTQLITEIDAKIHPFSIAGHVGFSYHNLHTDAGYMAAVNDISKEYARLRAKAEKRGTT